MLDLQAEQHDQGQVCPDLYEAVLHLKRRHDLHPSTVRPGDGLALRRGSERELVQELVKRFRDLPAEQQHRLPALLNSLAQLEVVVGDLESSQHDFQEVARLVRDPQEQAEAHHNVYRAALERRDWDEALAALRRAAALDADAFEPFPLALYEPERILGAGGFGTTFLCRERSGGRRVVIKALRADSLERHPAVLFREMQWVQEMDHPAVVRIHQYAYASDDEDRPYLVLEYFEGQTLIEYIAQEGRLVPEEWLEIAWPLARALQAAHARGVLHRSLRPAAVLLRRRQGQAGAGHWQVKLLDTGLSLKRTLIHASASSPEARAQTSLGRSVARTIAYAPFEVLGRPKGQVWVGPHSDVYSFGKLCAFALTGRPDPDDEDLHGLPEAWRQILADCTAWTIGQRPEHIGLIIDRLAELPGAEDIVERIEHDLHAQTIAEHTARLEEDPACAAAYINRGNAYARQGDFEKAVADYTRALELQPQDVGLYRRRALAHTRNRALDAALADYTQALALEPRNLEALANRGLTHAQKNEFEAAIADYNEALRLAPRDGMLLYNRGNAYYCQADYERAIADYTETIRLEPRNVWAYGNRGKAYALRGEWPRAVADFTRILQLDPDNLPALCDRAAAYRDLKQYESALADYTQALALQASAALYNERGLTHLARGDLDQAIADYTEALVLEPEHAGAYLLRGNAHSERGDSEQALADFGEAIRLNPQFASAYHNRGNVHAEEGRLEQAIADFTEAIRLEPNYASAHFNRANAHAERGEFEQAIAGYSEALRLEPNHASALNNRGNVYRRCGDVERALADFTAAIAADPQFSMPWFNRASIHGGRGEYDQALADYTEALRREPNDISAYHSRGRIYSFLGRYAEAIADNQEALKRNPEDAWAYNNLAWLWATCPHPEHRDLSQAIEHARRACELSQWQNASHLDTLAVAYAAAGQFAEAVQWQQRAIELGREEDKADFRSRLALYEAGRPFEEPPKGDTSQDT
jgi:tetratricopeptide (TPR) repeat protein